MKTMKKILALLLALTMFAALCACGAKPAEAPAPDSEPAAEAEAPAEAAPEAEPAEEAEEPANEEPTGEPSGEPSGEPTGEPSEAPAEIGEFTTIEEGKLHASTSPDFPPFEYTDDSGAVVGIEPEIMALIAERLGVELVFDEMDFDSALLAAQQGKSDLVMSGVTVTEDRKLVYDFTESYISIVQGIVSKEENNITEADLTECAHIGAQRGTTGANDVEDDYGADVLVAYDTYTTAFQALMNDQVDCIVLDDAVGNAYLSRYPGLVMNTTSYDPENFAFGVTKGNTELQQAINTALAELIADGTVQSIVDKYMAE